MYGYPHEYEEPAPRGKPHRHRQPQQNIDLFVYCEETESELDWSGRKIHVKNIPKHIDSKQLKAFFTQFGSVTSCKVIETNKRRPHCYGFVGFSQREGVKKALQSELVIQGHRLIAEILSPQKAHENLLSLVEGQEDDTYLFLPNIPKDTNKLELVKYFSTFGSLKHMKLAVKGDKETNSLYIQYHDLNSVTSAKSKRHRLLNISAVQPKLTLVCKIRVFNTGKYRRLLAAAEDLLDLVTLTPQEPALPTFQASTGSSFTVIRSQTGSSLLLKSQVGGIKQWSLGTVPTQPSSCQALCYPSPTTSTDSQGPRPSFFWGNAPESNYRINYPTLPPRQTMC